MPISHPKNLAGKLLFVTIALPIVFQNSTDTRGGAQCGEIDRHIM